MPEKRWRKNVWIRGGLKEVSEGMLKLIPLASVCGVGFSLRISSEPQIE